MVILIVEYFRGKFRHHHILFYFSADEILSFVESDGDGFLSRKPDRKQNPLRTTSLEATGNVKGFSRRHVPVLLSHQEDSRGGGERCQEEKEEKGE